ncbi:short-chain alcohol dehydrogenase [Spathaspora passalidarum NRRL Y-27907]|uniref:Short-chain alcohol dehydrogenase n=1 Tax=Spathaspora passalidarum (strain NRRL Y-27907 / 11-Y1) TaxID=619300 RepID=G3AQ50_SPAPN|nr:short-chain alcohol dehydrogenase [Spathaspora passalidarum NRRL Y-27907]EGW31397.1 short-chain alcohol dehydrogenase [Spathaspora passalidarum NRRL Y-27907]
MSGPVVPPRGWEQWKQIIHGFFPGKPKFTEGQYPSFEGKVVIVTGGNTGVGYETVKSLAGSTKAKLYIFSRSEEKTLEAIKQIQLEVAKEYNISNREIHFIKVDLSDLETIKPAVQKFLSQESRLDLIIHNAGVMTPPVGSKSKQGYELQLGTNTIGPHLLQRLLDPIFIETSKKNAPGVSRIVWVASSGHQFAPLGGFHWDDVNFEKMKVTNNDQMMIYGQSKAGNVIQARTWTRKHNTGSQIISSSICPGFLDTDLQRHISSFEKVMYKFILHPRRMGAYTELFAAFSPDVKDGSHSISFGVPGHARKDLLDPEVCDKVWNYLNKVTDPYM